MLALLPPSATQTLRRLTTSGRRRAVRPSGPESMTRSALVESLGVVAYEPGCVVEDDPGEIVRHAAPLDEQARARLREQQIARLRRDPAAVAARERRLAIERAPTGRVLHARFA